jgi:membrane protein DedA with SNARE-associated domain/rhodanese-related sulfurtransferase
MHDLISALQANAPWAVFLNVMLNQAGLPLPALPTILTAAALSADQPKQLAAIFVAGVAGAMIGDLVQYWFGRRFGRRVLALVCKISFSPDFCVTQSETLLAKVGPHSLLFSKFLPGISLLAVAMAGITGMPLRLFLLLDGVGASLFLGTANTLGWLFNNQITSLFTKAAGFGLVGALVALAAIGLYVSAKWLRRQMFIRRLRMSRITVAELRRLIDEGNELLILDVRPPDVRDAGGIIPGALGAHPAEIDAIIDAYSGEEETIVYCACPNEASAAIAAKHLRRAGFKRIRPLLGGIDAWVRAGQPVERSTHEDVAVPVRAPMTNRATA